MNFDNEYRLLYVKSHKDVKSALSKFRFGIKLGFRRHNRLESKWTGDIIGRLNGVDIENDPKTAIEVIDQIKDEFLATVVNRRKYYDLLIYWLLTAVLCGVAHCILGENGLLDYFKSGPVAGAVHGHLYSYIAFRYAVYGVLLGNALHVSFSRSSSSFDDPYSDRALLARPALNLILGLVLSYILCRLVAEGQLSMNVFGLRVSQDRLPEPGNNPGFRSSASLFLIGLAACTAADIYLQRLVVSSRESAKKAFGSFGRKDSNF